AINVQAGSGAIQADLNHVSGTVNLSGGSAHFASHARVLHLGNLKVDGDPTIVNDGDILISQSFSVPEDLAIISTANITANAAVTVGAGGHNVYMVAGAKLTPPGKAAGSPLKLPPLPPGQSITVSRGSDSGGSIALSNSTINAGSVTLVAYQGTGTGSGRISD